MEQEIIDGNKLIAEFMGLKSLTKREYENHPDHSNLSVDEYSIIEYQRYHTSWDWIMPVVEKIESMNYSTGINFIPGLGHSFHFLSGGAEINKSRAAATKIGACYKAVIDFINYYNETKSTN